ncbi:MAG: WD40 repeat domain-containing protein [Methanoregula sp.]|uniref:WD40 repeat domain-containing protein n=2 Tax=Methanoregula sp. TaxID=2052170 RepID=UPI003BAE33A9
MKIPPLFPVIGPFFFRRSVRGIARAAKCGDLQAVRKLTAIVSSCPDKFSRSRALEVLASLSSQAAIDEFCKEVIIRDNQELEKVAINQAYTPLEPGSRAVFLYVTGQDEALCRFDPDAHHPLLANGYATAPARIKNRVLCGASSPRMDRILAHALIGTDPVRAAGILTYLEWEVVISGLTREKAWDVLWLLVIAAPPSLTVVVLENMRVAGWKPFGDSMRVFEDLINELPEGWAYPAPEKPILSMSDQNSQCLRLAFSRDGTLLAAGKSDGKIAIWQVSSARLLTSLSTNAGSINFISFTSDNTNLIIGGRTGMIACYGIPLGNTIWSDKGRPFSCVAMSRDREEIIVSDDQGKITRLMCQTGKILLTISGLISKVTVISLSPDKKYIAFGHMDGTICCKEAGTGTDVWTVPGTGNAVRALAFTGQDNQLFVVYERVLPALRDGNTGIFLRTFDGFSGRPSCYAISAENSMAGIGSDDRVLRFWNMHDKNPIASFPFYNRIPTCCCLTPDANLAAVGCNDGTIFFFSVHERQKIKEFRGCKQSVATCSISPDGNILATTGGDGTVTLWSIPTGELLRTLRRPAGAITALALTSSAAGAGIIAGTTDGRIRIFSCEDGGLVRSIDMYTPSITTLAVSPDGTYLACAGKDASLRFWDLAKGGLVATCDTPKSSVRCLAFLPDRAACISCGWDGKVRIWDVTGGKPQEILVGHSSIITCCSVDPRGRFFVTGSNDTTLRIWQLTGEKTSVVLRGAKQEVSVCAISPDGTLLAAAGADPEIQLYHFPEGIVAGTIPQIPGRPSALAFTDDGLMIVVGYDHGTTAFYAVHGHSLIRILPTHSGKVTGIVAIKGEDCFVTSGTDGMIHIFRIPFMRPLSRTSFTDLALAREQAAVTGSTAAQWRFLCHLLSFRFQNEIELCPTYRDAGIYDIQIVG